jgi:glycosyltransferase involved in cell wall biosynthesis
MGWYRCKISQSAGATTFKDLGQIDKVKSVMESTPFVSVIIPVYNDAVRLKTCLQALAKQTYPQDAYEVIVVDNGSNESIAPIVAGFSQAQAAYEPRHGSYAARNTGIALARGDILAFIDSDCIPALDWIARGVANLLREPKDSIVGGKVEFIFQDPEHPTATELYDSIMHFNMKMYIAKQNFTGAGNLFTFARVFHRVGAFDSDLQSGGDYEWGQRATAFAYKLIYADDVRVAHPAISSFAQLLRKTRRVAKGLEQVNRKRHAPFLRFNRDFLYSLLPPVLTVIRLGRTHHMEMTTQIKIMLIWFAMQYTKIKTRWQEKLRPTSPQPS